MALDKALLKTKIKGLVNDMLVDENNSVDEYSDRLSTIIDDYVKSATIVYTVGLIAPSGAVTGVFEGQLE